MEVTHTEILAPLAIFISLLPLLSLALNDPKRLRSQRRSVSPASVPRGLLAAAVLLPGVLLIAFGEWPAFLIWVGAVTASGWLFAQILAWRARVPVSG